MLAARFSTLDALRAASFETLAATAEIGPVVAQSVYEFFHDPENERLLDDLRAVGVAPSALVPPSRSREGALALSGKTIVITGTLPKRTRPEAEELIKRHGGKTTGAVSKSTSLLLAGEEAGSKLDKARKLNVPIIDETELERLVGIIPGES